VARSEWLEIRDTDDLGVDLNANEPSELGGGEYERIARVGKQ
jgi:hypothetical protein